MVHHSPYGSLCLSQKWKSLAASLENEIRQVKQQRDHFQLHLKERQTAIYSSAQHVHQSGTGPAEGSQNTRHQETTVACAELCEQQEMDLASSMPSSADSRADTLVLALTKAYAAQLAPLAAESERMLSTGMTQEACHFLMQVRSMQLATQVCLCSTIGCSIAYIPVHMSCHLCRTDSMFHVVENTLQACKDKLLCRGSISTPGIRSH